MLRKDPDRWNDYFEFGMYILAGVCFVYFLIHKIYPKVFEAVLIVVTLIFVRILFKFMKIQLFPLLRFSILFFIFICMFMANEFGYYGKIPYLDKMEHLFSGVILCFVGIVVYQKINNQDDISEYTPTLIWFSLFFAMAMAGFWEIFEFTTDQMFGLKSQMDSITDTMVDMICGTIGAILTSIYLAVKSKSTK